MERGVVPDTPLSIINISPSDDLRDHGIAAWSAVEEVLATVADEDIVAVAAEERIIPMNLHIMILHESWSFPQLSLVPTWSFSYRLPLAL
jgi:hypothetical protein